MKNKPDAQSVVVHPYQRKNIYDIWCGKPHYKMVDGEAVFLFRSTKPKSCAGCGTDLSDSHYNRIYCLDCSGERQAKSRLERAKNLPKQSAAHTIVSKAVASGILPRLDGDIECVDCGKPAQHYDHRDYLKPLDVEPVCISCNCLRGPAENAA